MATINVGTEVANYPTLEKLLAYLATIYRDISKQGSTVLFNGSGIDEGFPYAKVDVAQDKYGKEYISISCLIPMEPDWRSQTKRLWEYATELSEEGPNLQTAIPPSYKKSVLTP